MSDRTDGRTDRPDPDRLLADALREGRGRLKIFLGAAPGVGKTWKMLAQARALLDDGTDVLAGVIETHGRAGTEEQLHGLPVLPPVLLEDRGRTRPEFDLAGALARRPALLLVDELAHDNAPGARHAKRWEDVRALLAAGIDVWCTLNIQHVESLNDDVARITGVRVTETLPDQVLDEADEIELIDLSPRELRDRLRDGRIYRPEVATRALENYFREGNLAALREIALRRTASRVDRDVRDWMQAQRVPGPWPASEHVLALIGPDAAGEAVVRYAKRLADALHAPWSVLHVERPDRTPLRRRSLLLARELGAAIETRGGRDLVAVAARAASDRNATQLVVGRAPPDRPVLARLRALRLRRRGLAAALLRQLPDLALHVVPSSPVPARQRTPPSPRSRHGGAWRAWAGAILLVGMVTAAGLAAGPLLREDTVGMMFLATVAATAMLGGIALSLFTAAAAFLSWDFFFIPPVHSITIGDAHDAVGLAVFAVVATVTGTLGGRVRAAAWAAQARIDSLRQVGAFGRALGEPVDEPSLLREIAAQAAQVAGEAVVLAAAAPENKAAADKTADSAMGANAAGTGPAESGGARVGAAGPGAAGLGTTQASAGATRRGKWRSGVTQTGATGASTTSTGTSRAGASRAGTIWADTMRAGAARAGDAGLPDPAPVASVPDGVSLDERSRAAARFCAVNAVETGHGTATLPSAAWRFVPLRPGHGTPVVLGVRAAGGDAPRTVRDDALVAGSPASQALEVLADQATLALDRMRLFALAAQASALQDTQKLRTALLGSLGHDLRTPLTGIRGAADTLRVSWDRLDGETRTDLLSSIDEDVVRMTRFLHNITELTRLESGQIVPRAEVVPVVGVIEAAVARVAAAAQATVSDAAPGLLALVDPALLEQVLVNVLDNAARYSPRWSHIAVRVSAARQADAAGPALLIEVADEGVGVPAADLPHLFDSFFRSTRGDRVAPGTGLGLAIARGLVEAMGGSIEATSPRPDVPRDAAPGTLVSIRIPARPVSATPA